MQGSTSTPLPLTPRELAAWRGLLRAHSALVRDLDAELRETHDLSLHEYEVLLLLVAGPRRPDADVGPRGGRRSSARAV